MYDGCDFTTYSIYWCLFYYVCEAAELVTYLTFINIHWVAAAALVVTFVTCVAKALCGKRHHCDCVPHT